MRWDLSSPPGCCISAASLSDCWFAGLGGESSFARAAQRSLSSASASFSGCSSLNRKHFFRVASFSPSLWCALAHVPTPGLNDTVAGILHPFTTPAHILILLGIGVLLGQNFQSHFG